MGFEFVKVSFFLLMIVERSILVEEHQVLGSGIEVKFGTESLLGTL